MKLNPRQRDMLRSIAHQPRTSHSFTHGPASVAPQIVQMYLDAMLADGLIRLVRSTYHITDRGERALYAQPSTATSRIHCNASMSGSYVPPPNRSGRPGADDHRQFKSFGSGA